MKTTQEISEASGSVYEVRNYGDVRNEDILTIFADEMTYKKLKSKVDEKDEYTELVVKYVNLSDNNLCTMVYFDDVMVLEIIRSRDFSSDMTYFLSELCDSQGDDEAEETEEE